MTSGPEVTRKPTRGSGRGAWISSPSQVSDPWLHLICIPYAGGRGRVFDDWVVSLPVGVSLQTVTLPGRGSRLREPPLEDLDVLVESLADALGQIPEEPYAILGYS